MKFKLPRKDVDPVPDDGRRVGGDILDLRDHATDADLRNRAIAPEQTIEHDHGPEEWCNTKCPADESPFKPR